MEIGSGAATYILHTSRSSQRPLFEGVCLTHVILAPGACGRGARAAIPDTTLAGFGSSASSGRSGGEFQKSMFGSSSPSLWATLGIPKQTKSCFLSNTPSLFATLGAPKRAQSVFLTNSPSLSASLGTPNGPKACF